MDMIYVVIPLVIAAAIVVGVMERRKRGSQQAVTRRAELTLDDAYRVLDEPKGRTPRPHRGRIKR